MWLELLVGGIAVKAIHSSRKKKRKARAEERQYKIEQAERERQWRQEEREREEAIARRVSTPCSFNDGITEEEFERIVRKAVKSVKRITDVRINGPVVYCTVRSQSGVSEWDFELDFNDYGHITGRCWSWQENYDSQIPDVVEDRIKALLHNR